MRSLAAPIEGMRLKRLIVHGFKSFADRTEFEFTGSGVTCIVGPNGCGKSNVIDAVKWVLGEQRPTSLRGREMTDVIFNGTIRRPPMGLCEGSLVFDNSEGVLPIEADEVKVTRRVFRTGETEYQVNGNACRLKDIRDLFAGTGLGSGGYGFMEQGKIDSVLASNPLERRKVFEEASGISRFRARKRETELKLNRVEDNLTRLADIVEEINRQIRSLKIHAGKARSYHQMSGRVKELQLKWSIHRYREISSEQANLEERLAALEEQRESQVRAREELRTVLKRIEGELENLLEGVSEARTRYAEVAERVTASKEKVELHTRFQEDQTRRLAEKRGEIEEIKKSLADQDEEGIVIVREREAFERDRERVAELRAEQEGEVGTVRGRTETLEGARQETEERLQVQERALAELAREEARREAALTHLEEQQTESVTRREALEQRREDLRQRLETRTGEQDAHTSTLEERRLALTEEERRSEELERAHAAATDGVRARDAELDRVGARVEVLQGVLGKREGLDAGTREILEEKGRNPEFLPGFRGLLFDLFEVDLAEARAVEAALGDAAQALVVETAEEALAGLRFLADQGKGGALFLPVDRFADVAVQPLNGLRPLADDVAPILSALVGGIEVVAADELERRLLESETSAPLLVSTDGHVLRDGRVLAAPPGDAASQGVVVLQAELKTLEKELPELEQACVAARDEMTSAREHRDASRARIKELSVALVKEEGEAARLDQEIVHAIKELDRLADDGARLDEAIARTKTGIGEARQEIEAVAERKKDTEERIGEAERELVGRRDELVTHRTELQRLSEALESTRVEEAKLIERLDALKARGERLAETTAESRRRMERDEREVDELEKGQRESARTVEEENSKVGSLEQEGQGLAQVLKEREGAADEVREQLRAQSEELDGLDKQIEGLGNRAGAEKGREGELRAAMQGLLERSQEELELDLAAAAAEEELAEQEAQEAAQASQEAAEGAEPPAEGSEPAADGAEPAPQEVKEETDWKEVENELRSLKEKIVRLGNVNLAAVEELEAAEERSTFILREQKDLLESREQLKKVLKNIESQSTAMFLETFNAVREHFSVIFRKLFGGGKADIILENEEDPLDSGIEIKARPPGKELRSITLLSGGERTMTAVALLFAIFRANPAPCALLDEVDAALDEDNTERFCHLLDDFMARSQFLIVTHSKRTMERADLLYGVTMPERGVSRRVAVRLEQMDEHGNIKDVKSVEREAAAEEAKAESANEAPSDEAPPEEGTSKPKVSKKAAKKRKAAPAEDAAEPEAAAEAEAAPAPLEAPAMAHRAKKPKS